MNSSTYWTPIIHKDTSLVYRRNRRAENPAPLCAILPLDGIMPACKRVSPHREAFFVDIDWFGQSCFRLREGNLIIITDPYDKSIGYNLPRLRADIVTISHDAPGHANAAAIKGDPKVLTRPGEYEVKGVFLTGIPLTLLLSRFPTQT